MNKRLTITEVEEQLANCVELLSKPQEMAIWKTIISNYHQLGIKLSQLKGEHPQIVVSYGRFDY